MTFTDIENMGVHGTLTFRSQFSLTQLSNNSKYDIIFPINSGGVVTVG